MWNYWISVQIKAVTNFHVALNMAISICSVQADSIPGGIAMCFRISSLFKVILIENNTASQAWADWKTFHGKFSQKMLILLRHTPALKFSLILWCTLRPVLLTAGCFGSQSDCTQAWHKQWPCTSSLFLCRVSLATPSITRCFFLPNLVSDRSSSISRAAEALGRYGTTQRSRCQRYTPMQSSEIFTKLRWLLLRWCRLT